MQCAPSLEYSVIKNVLIASTGQQGAAVWLWPPCSPTRRKIWNGPSCQIKGKISVFLQNGAELSVLTLFSGGWHHARAIAFLLVGGLGVQGAQSRAWQVCSPIRGAGYLALFCITWFRAGCCTWLPFSSRKCQGLQSTVFGKNFLRGGSGDEDPLLLRRRVGDCRNVSFAAE